MSLRLTEGMRSWLHKNVRQAKHPTTGRQTFAITYHQAGANATNIFTLDGIAGYMIATWGKELRGVQRHSLATLVGHYLIRDPNGPRFPPLIERPRKQKRARRTGRKIRGRATEIRIRAFLNDVVPGVGERKIREWAKQIAEECVVTENLTVRVLR